MEYKAYADVERYNNQIVEFAILVTANDALIDGLLVHIIPENVTRFAFNQQSKYCHCLSYDVLQMCAMPRVMAENMIVNFLRKYPMQMVIYENSWCYSSADVEPFIKSISPLSNCDIMRLPVWTQRVGTCYFNIPKWLKQDAGTIPLLRKHLFCAMHTLKHVGKAYNHAAQVKKLYGHHCSLYDAYQLYLFSITLN
jgi:hypothetical protein